MNPQSQKNTNPVADDLELIFINSINSIDAVQWNQLVPDDCPFLRHEFLSALEDTGCVSRNTGWLPHHIVIRNEQHPDNSVVGAMPLYMKGHSYGEFIFDWQWASAYQRSANEYYPKMVSQTPFTPLTSPKFLTSKSCDSRFSEDVRKLILRGCYQVVESYNVSSMHWLFIPQEEADLLKQGNLISRQSTFEYIWRNKDYQTMDDFLSTLLSRKRKKIRQERRSLTKNMVRVCAVDGTQINSSHWAVFENFYRSTVNKYYSNQYLNYEFFQQIGSTMPENLVMFLAYSDDHAIAGSLCMRGGDKLYGRYWGALKEVPYLHFETCYYAAIEYCIENNLNAYNAGVQGDHKLNRGFMPELSYSAHFIQHPSFADAIRKHAEHESSYVLQHHHELVAESPYHRNR